LQSPPGHDGESDSELLDLLADGGGEEDWVRDLALREGFARLPDRMRYIMEARYYREQTQEKIAAALGISQVQVSRLEKQALKLLREYWFS
jgi:RNA polymerase sporulation-specific sigma factor